MALVSPTGVELKYGATHHSPEADGEIATFTLETVCWKFNETK